MAKEDIQKDNKKRTEKEKFESLKNRLRRMIKENPKRINMEVGLKYKRKTQ